MLSTILAFASPWINQILQYDANAAVYFEKLENACIQVDIENLSFFILFDSHELLLSTACPSSPDTLLKGPLSAFTKLLLTKNFREATNLGLRIEGNLDIGETLQNLFFSLDIDWESWLSEWSGDITAYKIGDALRTTHQKSKSVLKTFSKNTRDYLQNNSSLMPSSIETNAFLQKVDAARAAMDRLEARLQRLETASALID